MTTNCCPPGSFGAPPITSQSPNAKGSLLTIGDSQTPVYYSPPLSTSSKGIVIFPDVWGMTDRTNAISDQFASQNYHIICVDCFRGETKATNPEIVPWLKKYPFFPVVKNDLKACFEFLNSKGVTEIGGMGFCWGAWALAKASSEGLGFTCGVGLHPAMKLEEMVFQEDVEAMLDKVSMPLLLLPAGNDAPNLKPGSETIQKLEAKGGKSILFETMVHGWVTRSDPDDPVVQESAKKALDYTLEFFQANL